MFRHAYSRQRRPPGGGLRKLDYEKDEQPDTEMQGGCSQSGRHVQRSWDSECLQNRVTKRNTWTTVARDLGGLNNPIYLPSEMEKGGADADNRSDPRKQVG